MTSELAHWLSMEHRCCIKTLSRLLLRSGWPFSFSSWLNSILASGDEITFHILMTESLPAAAKYFPSLLNSMTNISLLVSPPKSSSCSNPSCSSSVSASASPLLTAVSLTFNSWAKTNYSQPSDSVYFCEWFYVFGTKK